MNCETIDESETQWADEVRTNVWTETEDGTLVVDETARHQAIQHRAYIRFLNGWSEDPMTNWLEAEKEVDAAIFD